MPLNFNIPLSPYIQSYGVGTATVAWQTSSSYPASYYKYNIYTDLTPFVSKNSTLATTVTSQTATVPSPDSVSSFYFAVSSLDTTIGVESDLSVIVYVSFSNTASTQAGAIATDQYGNRKYLLTDSTGKLELSAVSFSSSTPLPVSKDTSSNTVTNPIFTKLTDGTAAAIVADAAILPVSRSVVLVGGSDGTNVRLLRTDSSGNISASLTGVDVVRIQDSSGGALTSTSSAIDTNIKSQTSAIKVSKSTSDNAVGNPLFVELSDGSAAVGTSSNPLTANIKDGSGNALTSTSNKLDVGLTGANTVKLNDSAGTAITLSGANLKTALFDSAGDAAVVADGVALPGSRAVVMVAGSDGSNIRLFKTDSSGNLLTTLTGSDTVRIQDSSGNTLGSTSGALDVNLKSDGVTALPVSATTSVNALANPLFVELTTGSAALTNTSNALDVNLKSVTGTRIQISKDSGANATSDPIYTQLTDGTSALNTSSGNLGVGLTGANTVKLNDSAGTAITLSGGNLKVSTFDSSGNPAIGTKGSTFPGTAAVVIVGGTDGTNTQSIATDTSGRVKVDAFDGSGNAITSTSSALDVNIKSTTSNIAVSIAAQTLTAVQVSPTIAANTSSNPFFIQLTDGSAHTAIFQNAATPTLSAAGVVAIAGNDGTNIRMLKTDTSGNLNTILTGTSTVRIQDSSGGTITATSGSLNVGLTGASTVKLADGSGTSITSTSGALDVNLKSDGVTALSISATTAVNTVSNPLFVELTTGSAALTNTSNALDINVKSVTGTNLPISIAAQTLTAVQVSPTTAANTLANPFFTRLSDGTNAAVVTDAIATPSSRGVLMVAGNDGSNIRLFKTDSSGNKLVSLTGTNTVRIQDSSGTSITLAGGNLKTNLYDASGNVAIGTKGSAFPGTAGTVIVGGTDGTNTQALALTTGGLAKVAISDGSANAITSTSSALDINLKSVTGTNLPISIAAQTLAAIAVSKTTSANAVANPIFVELSDGSATIGTSSNPLFVDIKDGSGNAITSTSAALDINVKSVTGTNLPISIAAQTLTALQVSPTTAANAVANPFFTRLTDGTAAIGVTGNPLFTNIKDGSGTALTSTSSALDINVKSQTNAVKVSKSTADNAVANPLFVELSDGAAALGTTGNPIFVNAKDGSGTALTSTSSALDINVKSVTGTNLPISIAAQTLAAVAISKTNAANSVSNPLFVELSDGAAALGTTGNPVFVDIKDGSGTALTSTSGKLDVGLTGANTVKVNDGSGNTISSTSSALDINVKSQTSAIKVSKSTSDNAVANPIFVELSDGTAALGTTGNPVFVDIKDGSGNALTSTSGALDVNLKSDGITAIPVSATSALNTVSNPFFVELTTGSAALTNTSNALDINVKSVTGTNLPISIAAQTLTAVIVSPTSAENTLANPFFNRLSDGTNAAIVTDAVASPASRGVVMVAGNDGSNIRLLSTDSSGRLIPVVKNATFGPTTTSSVAANASVNVSVTTSYVNQMLLLLEVRPNTADNTFSIDIYKDSGRTKRIFTLSNIGSDEFVTDENLAMNLVDSIMYMTITNNNVSGSRTYTIEGIVEVRN